jgi:hypothetical protein
MKRAANNKQTLRASFAPAASLPVVMPTEAEMAENRRRLGLPDNWMNIPLSFGPGKFDADSFLTSFVDTLNQSQLK